MPAPKTLAKKSGTEKRRTYAKPIQIRVTPAERAEFEGLAEDAGLSVPSFIRAMILTKPEIKPAKRPSLDRVLMGQLLGRLGKLGNNFNQMAHRLNEGKGVGSARIESGIEELKQLKNEIIEALKKLE